MRTWLRRWLGILSADDIEALIIRALVDADCCMSAHDEDIQRIVRREIQRNTATMARAMYGKD